MSYNSRVRKEHVSLRVHFKQSTFRCEIKKKFWGKL